MTLRYAYRLVGGEDAVAFGAKGAVSPLENFEELTMPEGFTHEVEIEKAWGKVKLFKSIANHHDLFYFEYLKRALGRRRQ